MRFAVSPEFCPDCVSVAKLGVPHQKRLSQFTSAQLAGDAVGNHVRDTTMELVAYAYAGINAFNSDSALSESQTLKLERN